MITHAVAGEDRRYKLCRCSKCGIEAVCTPTMDFYAKKVGDSLECENCFLAKFGMTFVNVDGPERGRA